VTKPDSTVAIGVCLLIMSVAGSYCKRNHEVSIFLRMCLLMALEAICLTCGNVVVLGRIQFVCNDTMMCAPQPRTLRVQFAIDSGSYQAAAEG
jgi:hypothetical protein